MFTLKKIILFTFCCFVLKVYGQESDTLNLNLASAETILLENNLSLLAEQLNINKAEAEIIQAKVWPNPTFSINEVNIYTSSYQKQHAEELPSLFGSESLGKYRQISVQLEQLIETAGKRKKRKAIAEVSSEMATAYLSDFLLSLKTQFRKNVFNFRYHQGYIEMLNKQLSSLQSILKAYQNQYKEGNINKVELIRLRSSELKLKDELIKEENTLGELKSSLIILLNLPENTSLSFHSVFKPDYNYQLSFDNTLHYLQEQALEHRPDMLLLKLKRKLAGKELSYEKSLAIPDLSFSVGYDRGGGIYQDFMGLGLSMDLPFSNPNKGNIQKAQINVQQQDYYQKRHVLTVKSDVRKKYEKVLRISRFFDSVDAEYVNDLNHTMEVYTEYFRLQSINIIAFMDFLEAYIDNKQAILENQRKYLDAVEELKYATGLEFNN